MRKEKTIKMRKINCISRIIRREMINKMMPVVILGIILMSLISTLAAAVPSLDFNQFFGEVKGIDEGTKIIIKGEDKVLGESAVKGGKYGYYPILNIPGESAEGARKGETLTFYANDKQIVLATFNPGEATKLDLVLAAAAPVPYCGDNDCNEDPCSCKTDCGACPTDTDDDGILDVDDNILFIKEKVAEKTKNFEKENIKIKIDNNEKLENNYEGKKEIRIQENEKPIIKFDFDFDKEQKLDLGQINVEKQSSLEQTGYIVVRGIESQANSKTIYLDKLNKESKSVCIKDAPVDSISQMSEKCNGESEIFLNCDGTKKESYVCNDLGSQFEVSGLKNSAAKEVTQEQEKVIEKEQSEQEDKQNKEVMQEEGDTAAQQDLGKSATPKYLCEDGIDNDDDLLIDSSDPGCTNRLKTGDAAIGEDVLME
ncbi:hypothetical protein J4206_02745 [Candidatus Woesearchaeota archaeon]|nr:hypothetical protein [Candidatus Woesearchaeota archaeon]